MFGEDERYFTSEVKLFREEKIDKRGMVLLFVDFLLKECQEMEEHHDHIITCSMYEIYKEQIRDLGKAYSTQDDSYYLKEKEGLQISENSNGQVSIKGLSAIRIKTIDEVYKIIDCAVIFSLNSIFKFLVKVEEEI